MIKYMCIMFTSVLVASISQILLKKSANQKYENKIKEYLNILVIIAYCLLLGSTILTMIAYKGIQLSQGIILESLSYILIPIFSYFIFKENISKRKIVGIFTIILGILIFSILG